MPFTNPINVLSLFDGMSCGQIAFERAGIPVKNYYASEIDKYAIKIAQKNYPKTIQLGDIRNWMEWNIEVPDLIIAGSPCQGFSNAGLGLNFDDPRSALFFTFKDILFYWVDKNPKLKWMLENVKMKKVWQDVISDFLGVEPVLINSALVSAQERKRLYWMNWAVEQPQDRGIFLKDIIEQGEVDRDKSYTIDANYFKGGNPRSYFEDGRRQLIFEHQPHKRAMVREVQGAAIRNQVTKRGVEEQLNIRKNGKSNAVVPSYPAKLNGMVQVGMADNIRGKDQWRRVYSVDGKSPTLVVSGGGHHEPKIAIDDIYYRKLIPLECERLQTVPECDIIDSLWQHIMKLSNQNRTCVPVEISSGRLIKLVGNVENGKLPTPAKLVTKSLQVNNPLSEFTALLNAGMQIEVQILKYTPTNSVGFPLTVDNVENWLQFKPHDIEEISALSSAFINSIEVKIIVNGLEVLHLRDKNLSPLLNGEMLLNQSGKEITKPVDGVVYINPNQNIPTMFITLSPLLLVQRLERIQTILCFYAQHAIDGYTLRQMLIDGHWICPKTNTIIEMCGYTSGVSNTQRYRMLGNGWTVDVIARLFSYL